MQDCPHCGADVTEGRLACRECGSDIETGWGDPQEIDYQSVDLGDEFSEEEKAQKNGRQKLIASILIAGFPIGLVLWWLPTQKAIAFSFAILLLLGVLSSRKNY